MPAEALARKCATVGCEHGPVAPTEWTIALSCGPKAALRWACLCGWSRVEPVGAGTEVAHAQGGGEARPQVAPGVSNEALPHAYNRRDEDASK